MLHDSLNQGVSQRVLVWSPLWTSHWLFVQKPLEAPSLSIIVNPR